MASLQTAQVANYDFGAAAAAIVLALAALASITLTGQPTTGQVVVIGTRSGVETYEFTSSTPAAGHIGVTIGAAYTDTAANLNAAINTAAAGCTSTVGGGVVSLTDSVPGAAGNQNTISENASNLTVAAWAGGVDDSLSVGVLEWTVKFGGKINVTLLNPMQGPNGIGLRPVTPPIVATIQFSKDGVTWYNSSSSANGQAVVNQTVNPHQSLEFNVIARAGQDLFMRLSASGGGRGQIQLRHLQSVGLDIVRV